MTRDELEQKVLTQVAHHHIECTLCDPNPRCRECTLKRVRTIVNLVLDSLNIRSEILRFAQVMEAKMVEGEAKRGDWRGYTLSELQKRWYEERNELSAEVSRRVRDAGAIIRECADNANVALMIAVVIGAMGAGEP
jgi:hypothetical protein